MSRLSLFTSSPISVWKEKLRQNFKSVRTFVDYLELDEKQQEEVNFEPPFAIQVPLRLAQKMRKKSLTDPLVLQFLPLNKEKDLHAQFNTEPVCDSHFKKTDKLLHKYEGRVLLVCTSACAMHCRYCFRQNFDYMRGKNFDEEIAWIEKDSSIREVILSGGDPLSLSNLTLNELFERLGQISHVKKIRIHTRFIIGIPERIDEEFLSILKKLPQQIYFVIHCNHSKELDEEIFHCLDALKRLGCIILNQAVLLKNVNDTKETLGQLCLDLSDRGIIPYYLHQLDRIQGAAHFEVEEEQGLKLINEIATFLPGYAVPKYVREIPGQPNKTPLY